LPPGERWFRRHPIKVYVGQPKIFPKTADFDQVSDSVMSQIVDLERLAVSS
jgi:hypothetical protein